MYNLFMNKILIADDTKSWLIYHKELIDELYGGFFNITEADSAFNALEIIKRNVLNPFNIIITDLQMEDKYYPKLAGEWLIEQIKNIKEYNCAHIIIISAMYNIEMIAKNYNVECISKNMLVRNKLLMKYMFEKLMPSLTDK